MLKNIEIFGTGVDDRVIVVVVIMPEPLSILAAFRRMTAPTTIPIIYTNSIRKYVKDILHSSLSSKVLEVLHIVSTTLSIPRGIEPPTTDLDQISRRHQLRHSPLLLRSYDTNILEREMKKYCSSIIIVCFNKLCL